MTNRFTKQAADAAAKTSAQLAGKVPTDGPTFKIHTAHHAICKRYEEWHADADSRPLDDRKSREMDLAALTIPMDWDALLAASDFDFIHDVSGIHAYIDRTTGDLTNHFLPRFARKEAPGE